ncbi:hypothetical protein Tco_0033721 [Tanacetum coccineum]
MTPEIATAVLPKIATVVWLKVWFHLFCTTEKQDGDSEQNNGSLAVVPWVPKGAHHQAMLEVEVPHAEEVSDMMDADDMETTTMDIKDNNFQQMV